MSSVPLEQDHSKIYETFLTPCFHIRVIYGIRLFWHTTMSRLWPPFINFSLIDDFTLTNDLDKSPIMHIFMEMQKRSMYVVVGWYMLPSQKIGFLPNA